jgi:hypothetical protein
MRKFVILFPFMYPMFSNEMFVSPGNNCLFDTGRVRIWKPNGISHGQLYPPDLFLGLW